MARGEGAGRALAVHAHAARLTPDLVPLHLRDVVANVVDESRALGGVPAEHLVERTSRVMGHELPVGEGEVRRGVHRSPIVACFG